MARQRWTHTEGRIFCSSSKSSSPFFDQVETTVNRTLDYYKTLHPNLLEDDFAIKCVEATEREAVMVSMRLFRQMRNIERSNRCKRCWLQRNLCICNQIPSIESSLPSSLRRIFILAHAKEVFLAVDTMKLLLMGFPDTCRLVVAGVPERFQDTMAEMNTALLDPSTRVLFPTDDAKTVEELNKSSTEPFDLIVLDGTWEQAQKLHKRYLPRNLQRISLSEASLSDMSKGKQLRRHPIKAREIATAHAVQLLLQEMGTTTDLGHFQDVARSATKKQLGPIRFKQ